MATTDEPAVPAAAARPLLCDDLTEKLRRCILSRRGSTAIRISTERELAEMHGVSRVSVRRAVKKLVAEGLLTQRQGSGTYITPEHAIGRVQVIVAADVKPSDPFYNEMLAEFAHDASARGVGFDLVREGVREPDADISVPLVVVGLVEPDRIRAVARAGRTVVSTQYYPDSVDVAQVLFDDYRIGVDAAEVLSASGHRRVAQLCGPRAYASAIERKRGFLETAERLGMEVVNRSGKMNWRSGYALGVDVLKLLEGDSPPTAVFAANDWMALGLVRRLVEARVSIPQTLSVVGCDDIHLAAEVDPALSTFRWDMALLAAEVFAAITVSTGRPPLRPEPPQTVETHPTRVRLPAQFVRRTSLAGLP